MVRLAAAAVFACVLTTARGTPADSQQADYLIVRLGDEAATPEKAAEFLQKLSAWLEEHVSSWEGRQVSGTIANRQKEAQRLLQSETPELALVSPGFYLGPLREAERPARPVAQVPRFGSEHTRYYVVAPAEGPSSLAALRGENVVTTFDFDRAYLGRVVLPKNFQPGQHFELEGADNLADEMFSLLQESEGAPAALLLDEELKRFFEKDDLVWSSLEVVWTSDPLPPDLIVALGDWDENDLRDLQEALLAMGESTSGRELLGLMDSTGPTAVKADLLSKARNAYDQAR